MKKQEVIKMKVEEIYRDKKSDKLIESIKEFVKINYPNVEIRKIKITEKNIFIKTEYYGNITLIKSDFI